MTTTDKDMTAEFKAAVAQGLDELLHEMRNDGLVVDLPKGDVAYFGLGVGAHNAIVLIGHYSTFTLTTRDSPAIGRTVHSIVEYVRREMQQPGERLYLSWRVEPEVYSDNGEWTTRARFCAIKGPHVSYDELRFNGKFNGKAGWEPFRLGDFGTSQLRRKRKNSIAEIAKPTHSAGGCPVCSVPEGAVHAGYCGNVNAVKADAYYDAYKMVARAQKRKVNEKALAYGPYTLGLGEWKADGKVVIEGNPSASWVKRAFEVPLPHDFDLHDRVMSHRAHMEPSSSSSFSGSKTK